jgi:prolipoprotein diacylglyceryltransferase
VIGYGVLRSLIEQFRDDSDRGLYTIPIIDKELSTSTIIGVVSAILGLGLMVVLIRRYRRDPASLRLWEQVPAKVAATKVEQGGGKRRKRH